MRIFIDEGHGGHDPGGLSNGAPRVEEEDVVLTFGDEFDRICVNAGHHTARTRVTDKYHTLSARAELANRFNADVFISFHCNVSGNELAEGAWVIHANGSLKGAALARAVFDEIRKIPGIEDKDPDAEVYPDDTPWVGNRELTVLRKTRMPAILIELGFLTNPEDIKELTDPRTMKAICLAVLRGLEKYAGVIQPEKLVPKISTAPHPGTFKVVNLKPVEVLALPLNRVAVLPDESVDTFLDRLFAHENYQLAKEILLLILEKMKVSKTIIAILGKIL